MRTDMAKVIVERPRVGSRARGEAKGYRRSLQRIAEDELPVREGMKRLSRGGTKYLNEHLGPLRRYLDSQVGRPWNKVFSEICARIDRDSAVQDHVRDHVADYVTVHVILIDGIPCDGEGGWLYGEPLHRRYWKPWYVCPRSGLLRRVATPSRKRRDGPTPEQLPRFIRVNDARQCRRIDGAWHIVELKTLPLVRSGCREHDVVLHRPVAELDSATARTQYGAHVYAASKRRLARKELHQLPIPMALWD